MRTIPLPLLTLALAFLIGTSPAGAEPTNLFHFKLPHARAFRLQETNGPWLRAWPEGEGTNWVEFGARLVLQVEAGADAARLAGGLPVVRRVNEGIYILDAGTAANAARLAQRLAAEPGVAACYPVMRRPHMLQGPYAPYPTDKAFFQLWPLENRNADGSHAGPDLNVRAAWPYTHGEGVTVAVDDVGVELAHPELSNNAAGAPHHNFVLGTTNGNPVNRTAGGAHGTEIAGLLDASLDDFRMVGVAPKARLASEVIFDSNLTLAADDQLMDAYEFASNEVAIQNHSWGAAATVAAQVGPTALEQAGISNALAYGRHGLGTIMVRAAGNGRGIQQDANDSGWASDPRAIAVASLASNGRVASYSDPGACLLLAAPSGDPPNGFNPLFTTDLLGTDGANTLNFFPPNQDLNNYVFSTLGFSGTSASAPQISGVAALMLSVNTNLTWRDVQQILLLSSRQFDFADPALSTNGAGFAVSDNLGYGVPDAGIAVSLARLWTNVPAAVNVTLTSTAEQDIPASGLNVVLTDGAGLALNSAIAAPDLGAHADRPTALLPLVDVGLATNAIGFSLTNRGALIERGVNNYIDKINFVRQAGAAFAVIYNYPLAAGQTGAPGGDDLLVMGGTDFAPIPAVFIGNTDGENLKSLQSLFPTATAQIKLASATYSFAVTNTLLCEHVAVRILADNQIRGNLRITLTSPSGTISVLGRYNSDVTPGPTDWTYYTTHCFYENSAGTWTVNVTDEGEGNFGQINQVSLTISGTPAPNGSPRSRQQILDSYLLPNPQAPVQPDFSPWIGSLGRVSWTAQAGAPYEVFAGTNPAALNLVTNITGVFPVTEWFPNTQPPAQFFAVKKAP
ncbi:MAG TPA: S8 family serine peptidase [Verrucomicrobiae bacterium]|jgi:subtilisin-like proprotein convertase family protein/subtilisin family serine protease|nr:S8 family serine peptidase [Verrucomicrobiae bacterium]